MSDLGLDTSHRCDIFNLLDGQRDWDAVLFEDGFCLRAEYKKALVRHGCIAESDIAVFDALTLEARKELASERIVWRNLPKTFSVHLLPLPYRSPMLASLRLEASRIIGLDPNLSEAEKGNILLSRIFPYRRLVSDLTQKKPGLETRIRDELINMSDNEEAVVASRKLGIDPVGRRFGLRDVKELIRDFCEGRVLAIVSQKKIQNSELVVGKVLPNGLVLVLVLWEVRSKTSHGSICYSMDIGIDLVTEGYFLSGSERRAGLVWGGIEIGSEFFPYGLKSESVIGFYVALAHWLRCFELLSDLAVGFFDSSNVVFKK